MIDVIALYVTFLTSLFSSEQLLELIAGLATALAKAEAAKVQ